MGISINIRDRLIAIERTMLYDSEAVKAAEYIPEAIQPFQLPVFINFPVGAARARRADTFYEIERTWNIRLWGRKEGDGGRAENEERMLDLIDLTYALFLPSPRLELNYTGLTNVVSALLTGDGGIEMRSYPTGETDNARFFAVNFSMRVTYRSICS